MPPTTDAPARLLRRVLDALFPQQCAGCGRFGAPLCTHCLRSLPAIDRESACLRCRAPLARQPCPRCDTWDALAGAFPAFYHEAAARAAVHALKYQRNRALAPLMAREISSHAVLPAAGAACFVPLHPARWRQRGFNQAELIARSIGLPMLPGRLRRIRNTRSQVGLNRSQRRENMAGAFTYEGPPLGGQAIVIVDDVITTGATVNECARVLRAHGAGPVFAASFTVWKPAAQAPGGKPIED